jgi:hypothetical protein
MMVETAGAQSIMHEASGQQTSGRVIAQQCTGMQSIHARTIFLGKDGYTIRMAVNLQDHHPYNLSSLIHLTLQQCFYAYRSATFLILHPWPNPWLHNAQFRVVYKQNGLHQGQCRLFDILVHLCINPWFYCTLPMFAFQWFLLDQITGRVKWI